MNWKLISPPPLQQLLIHHTFNMSRHSPRNPLYIVVRSLQIVFCIVCLGVTGYLRFGNFITYSYYSYYDDYGWSNYPYKTKRDAMPEPMPKGGKGSSGYSSSSSSSSSYDDDDTTTKYIDPVIPLGLLIAGVSVAVFLYRRNAEY